MLSDSHTHSAASTHMQLDRKEDAEYATFARKLSGFQGDVRSQSVKAAGNKFQKNTSIRANSHTLEGEGSVHAQCGWKVSRLGLGHT